MEQKIIYEGQKTTPEQIEKIKHCPIVYDEDCQKLIEKELRQFKRVNPKRQKAAN